MHISCTSFPPSGQLIISIHKFTLYEENVLDDLSHYIQNRDQKNKSHHYYKVEACLFVFFKAFIMKNYNDHISFSKIKILKRLFQFYFKKFNKQVILVVTRVDDKYVINKQTWINSLHFEIIQILYHKCGRKLHINVCIQRLRIAWFQNCGMCLKR